MDYKTDLTAFIVHNFEKTSKNIGMSGKEQLENPSSEQSAKSRIAKVDPFIQDYTRIMEMESRLLEDLIKPLMFLIRYFLPFHDIIKYDQGTKSCIFIRGSFLRKVLCITWELLIVYRLGIKAGPSLSKENGSDSIVSKAAYLVFTLFSLTGFYVGWAKTQCICDIFNRVLGLADLLHLNNKSPPRIKIVKYGTLASWLFVTFYVLSSIAIYLVNVFYRNDNPHKANLVLSPAASHNISGEKLSSHNFDVTEIHLAKDYNIFLQVISAVGSFTSIFGWMLQFLHIGIWGLFFRQLILVFYWRLDTIHNEGKFIKFPEEIRTFNKIVSIMDDYNKIYGVVNLFGAVVIVAYTSLSATRAFTNLSNVLQLGGGIHLLLSYVPQFATAVWAAEVQRVAGNFAGILKNEYGRFTEECGDAAESLCGISFVHYDLSTSNIGLKGTGFYTVSYQFITTIVSVIITYSILVLQFLPHDDTVVP